jgi:hypothetical protein
LVSSAADRDRAKTHRSRVLNAKVPEPTNTLHCDELPRLVSELRIGLNTVMPAHSSGAASSVVNASGKAATASAGTIVYSP